MLSTLNPQPCNLHKISAKMAVATWTTTAGTSSTCRLYAVRYRQHCSRTLPILCSKKSKQKRGFSRQSKDNKVKKVTTSPDKKDVVFEERLKPSGPGESETSSPAKLQIDRALSSQLTTESHATPSHELEGQFSEKRESSTKNSGAVNGAPGLSFRTDGKSPNIATDLQFEKRLEAIKRSALEQKKSVESKEYGAIDYDAPIESDSRTIGVSTKIGVGVAVLVFGLVFALGDYLLTESDIPTKEAAVVSSKLSQEEKQNLQTRLQQFEATLAAYPDDSAALEGTAVTLAELGEYTRATSLLEDLTKKKPNDPDAFRLLGEVKYELGDYEGSAAAYRRSTMVSKNVNFEVLRGLTNALLAAKKPDEAVQVLLASRGSLEDTEKSTDQSMNADGSTLESKAVDPIQLELLLGKAYSDWGHVSDAVSVYDQLISSHPDDFRGYLAKGIILKENGSVGDAERMFIQARFFAPEKAKALVDRYSRK